MVFNYCVLFKQGVNQRCSYIDSRSRFLRADYDLLVCQEKDNKNTLEYQ